MGKSVALNLSHSYVIVTRAPLTPVMPITVVSFLKPNLLLTTTQTKNQVQSGLLLNVVIGKSAAILQLLTSENQTLLVWWNSLLVLDFCLHVVDGIR